MVLNFANTIFKEFILFEGGRAKIIPNNENENTSNDKQQQLPDDNLLEKPAKVQKQQP